MPVLNGHAVSEQLLSAPKDVVPPDEGTNPAQETAATEFSPGELTPGELQKHHFAPEDVAQSRCDEPGMNSTNGQGDPLGDDSGTNSTQDQGPALNLQMRVICECRQVAEITTLFVLAMRYTHYAKL